MNDMNINDTIPGVYVVYTAKWVTIYCTSYHLSINDLKVDGLPLQSLGSGRAHI